MAEFDLLAKSDLQKRYSMSKGMPNWGQGQSLGATPQAMTPAAPTGNFSAAGDYMGNPGGGPPKMGGGWTEKANIGLGVAQVGLGVYNALEQSKMNKFMRGYYGDQMDLQRTDFGNAAKSTNAELAARQERIAGAQGLATGSAENKAAVGNYMSQWGVKESY